MIKRVKCIYCGTDIEIKHGHNPEDGLHDIPEGLCCSKCNTITMINRKLKGLVDSPRGFDACICGIKEELEKLAENRDEIIHYYIEAKK